MKSSIIRENSIRELEKIAKLVFPMEMEAQIPMIEMEDTRFLGRPELICTYGDVRFYEHSETFENLIDTLRLNGFDDNCLEIFAKDRERAIDSFRKYSECQKRRYEGRCKQEVMDLAVCEEKQCNTIGFPSTGYMYDWFRIAPCIAWHSHVTSRYGNIAKLSYPSGADSVIIARRRYCQNIPIEGEMITCTSETGEQITRLFEIPSADIFRAGQEKRKEKLLVQANIDTN